MNRLSLGDQLSKLSRVLNYQLSTTLLIVLTYAGILTIIVATIAATIFSPYILYILYSENKFGWITFFILMVLFPMLIIILLGIWELMLIPLALAYFYYFLLKFVVRECIQERNAKRVFEEQLKLSKEKEKQEENLNYLIQK